LVYFETLPEAAEYGTRLAKPGEPPPARRKRIYSSAKAWMWAKRRQHNSRLWAVKSQSG
jgi:hypothetical protein